MKRSFTAAALTLVLPVAAAAQGQQQRHGQEMGEHAQMMQPGMQRGMMHGGMQGMMMPGMAHGLAMMDQPGPGMLLQLRSTLGLTDAQVEQLETMHQEAREAMQTHREAARAARMRAHEAMTGETPDLDAFQQALEEAAQHDVEAMVAMARVHAQAVDALKDDQRATLHTLMQGMHELQGGMHGDGVGEGMPQGMHRNMDQSG